MRLKPGLVALACAAMAASSLVVIFGATAPASAVPAFRLLITGDSITQGSSGDYTWRYRLWDKLQSTAPGNVEFVGSRTDLFDNVAGTFGSQYYATPFPGKAHATKWGGSFYYDGAGIGSEVASSNPKTLVVMLGSNDLAYLTSPAQTVDALHTYINQARAAHPGIDIVAGEVVNRWDPWAQTYTLNAETTEYASLLATLANSLDTPAERVVIAHSRTGWDAAEHTYDGTHPNPTGEAVLAQRVSEALAQLGIGTSGPDISGPKTWDVAGSPVGLDGGVEQVGLSWNRSPSGAFGMFIETRLLTVSNTWTRLPWAVGGDGWTSGGLAGGGTYQYRVVPSKGFSTGLAGPNSPQITVTGKPLGVIQSLNVTAGGDSVRRQTGLRVLERRHQRDQLHTRDQDHGQRID